MHSCALNVLKPQTSAHLYCYVLPYCHLTPPPALPPPLFTHRWWAAAINHLRHPTTPLTSAAARWQRWQQPWLHLMCVSVTPSSYRHAWHYSMLCVCVSVCVMSHSVWWLVSFPGLRVMLYNSEVSDHVPTNFALPPCLGLLPSNVCVVPRQVDTVIFDDELSPGQQRNLERALSGGRPGARVCLGCRVARWHTAQQQAPLPSPPPPGPTQIHTCTCTCLHRSLLLTVPHLSWTSSVSVPAPVRASYRWAQGRSGQGRQASLCTQHCLPAFLV